MDIRGERRDDDALIRVPHEDGLKRGADRTLGRRITRSLRICGFAHHQQDAGVPDLADPREIHHAAVDRRCIQFEVAGMEHHTHRGRNGKRAGVGNRVVHMNKFH